MSFEHTKGPWRVETKGGKVVIKAPDSGRTVCEFPNGPIDQIKADAKAIAKTPDLIEMLVDLSDELDDQASDISHLLRKVRKG